MTEAELDQLCRDCPRLYHVAIGGAWPTIRRHGLLSTSALLDLFGVDGAKRHSLEAARRPAIVPIRRPNLGTALLRDQSPMDDAGLRRALPPEIAPADWYRLLNGKVFFWLSEVRLHRLTTARAYRDRDHDVLVLDTRRLIAAYRSAIWLCPINSGATKPFAAPRGPATFARIADYDYAGWSRRRRRDERVVELCVDHGVADIERFVVDAYVIAGTERRHDLVWERPEKPPQPLAWPPGRNCRSGCPPAG
jgi:hypothetical protein